MSQFKHESQNYVPLQAYRSTPRRPFWISPHEVYLFDRIDLPVTKRVVEIKMLTRDKFLEYQVQGAIPKEYVLDDWIIK